MDRTERFYKIDQMIHDRKLVPFVDLMAALEVSRATLKRDLEYMRNRLNAPIVWDRHGGLAAIASIRRTPKPAPSTSCPACGSTRARCMRC
jgi:predicted DNA-binding transcriptional regulator YafY